MSVFRGGHLRPPFLLIKFRKKIMAQFVMITSILTCLFSAAFVNYRIAKQRYYWERILEAIRKEADKSIEAAERIEKATDENKGIVLMLIEKQQIVEYFFLLL
jgi:lipopolysaccharide export LptBFGC system permease protein LptF